MNKQELDNIGEFANACREFFESLVKLKSQGFDKQIDTDTELGIGGIMFCMSSICQSLERKVNQSSNN